jgi:hypothetical protein
MKMSIGKIIKYTIWLFIAATLGTVALGALSTVL